MLKNNIYISFIKIPLKVVPILWSGMVFIWYISINNNYYELQRLRYNLTQRLVENLNTDSR